MDLIESKNRLILAYETVLNPTTNIQERKDAEAFCEKLKKSGYSAIQLGLSLLDARNGHSIHLRNLGVNFIEFSLKNFEFEPHQFACLKNQFWSFVFFEFGTFDGINEKILVKEKVSNCMAILAGKLWLRPEDDPAQWNDFFEGILENVLKSQELLEGDEKLRRQEYALLTISQLINLIRTPVEESGLGEERRLVLHSGLEIVLPPFSDWLFQNFPIAVHSKVNWKLLNSAVNCFRSLCTWMNNLNSEGIKNFLSSSIEILHDYETMGDVEGLLSLNILETIQSYFSLRCFQASEYKILEFYLITLYPKIFNLIQEYLNDSHEESSYQKLKLLIGSLFSIGNRFICNRKHPLLFKGSNYDEILFLFISIGQIPSLTIYLDFLEFFTNLIRNEKTNLKPHLLSQIFMVLATRLGKSHSEDRRNNFNEMDFEEVSEFQEFHKLSRVRSGELIKILTSEYPEKLLEFSYNALGTFIQNNTKPVNNVQWEALLLIEDYVSRGLEDNSNSNNKNNCHNSFCLLHLQLLVIHSPIPNDDSVLERWISCVKNFTSLQGICCPTEDFKRSVEVLFYLVNDRRSDHVRSLAASSILKLADTNSSLFLPFIEPLISSISELLSENSSGSISGSWERKLFSELILILMSQPSLPIEKQMILFSFVTDPLVKLLSDAKIVLFSESDPVIALMKHIGFNELSLVNIPSSPCRKFTSNLNLLLSILQILFKRIEPLVKSNDHGPIVQSCLQVLDELIGFLMLMIQCIHKLGKKEIWVKYFNNSEWEYNEYYPHIQGYREGNDTKTLDLSSSLDSSSVSVIAHITGWTRHYRHSCYLVLGMGASSFGNNFYNLPNFIERFLSQTLSSLETLNLSDWNLLIKLLLKPVLISCPRELIPSLLSSSLSGLISLLGEKLKIEWDRVMEANSSIKPLTGSSLNLEILHESKCVTLSSGFINFLYEIFNIPQIDTIKTVSLLSALQADDLLPEINEKDQNNLLSTWFFLEAPEKLLFTLNDFLYTAMITWPRSVGVYNKLVALQMRLLPCIMAKKHQDLPKSIFLSKSVNYAFSCWANPSWTDYQSSLINLLVELYKWSFLFLQFNLNQNSCIFDPDAMQFVKTSLNIHNNFELSIFESELILKYPIISKQELSQLRISVLSTELGKSQKTALRNLLQKYSKPPTTMAPSEFSKEQEEISSRLIEMKKRIRRAGGIEENENFDNLLSDLFNEE